MLKYLKIPFLLLKHNFKSSTLPKLAIKFEKGQVGRGRTVPVGTTKHHLRPNSVLSMFHIDIHQDKLINLPRTVSSSYRMFGP